MSESDDVSNSVPLGWGDRHNQMSEHDMKLGGMAATKFAAKTSAASVYSDDPSGVYKSSDQVRAFYLSQHKDTASEVDAGSENATMHTSDGDSSANAGDSSLLSTPIGWEARQKARDSEAKQYGAFARKPMDGPPQPATANLTSVKAAGDQAGDGDFRGPEIALLQIATQTLESLAVSLESNNRRSVKLTLEEKTAFANAVKNAMAALAKAGS